VIPQSVRIFVCTEPQDMRRSFDSLALVVKERLQRDPQNGALYVFANRRANRLKVLWFDHNGYCILYKRLHRALFRLPEAPGEDRDVRIDGRALAQIFAGIDRKNASRGLTPDR
jgi:transposase